MDDKQEKFLNVLKKAPVAQMVLGKNGRIEFVNEHLSTLLEYQSEEILDTMPVDFLCSNRESQSVFESALNVVDMKGSYQGELSLVHRNGESVYVWADIHQIEENGDKYFVLRDITTQKKRENDLIEFNKRIERLHRLAGIATWERRLDGEQMNWSSYQYQLHEVKQGEVIPTMTFWYDQIFNTDTGKVRSVVNTLISNEKPAYIEYRIVLKSGVKKWVKTHFDILKDSDGERRILAVTLDISEAKDAEVSLTKKVKELEVLNKVMIGRELKMIELKRRLSKYEPNETYNELKKEIGNIQSRK
jgi:PAS domain S-box-containing protein